MPVPRDELCIVFPARDGQLNFAAESRIWLDTGLDPRYWCGPCGGGIAWIRLRENWRADAEFAETILRRIRRQHICSLLCSDGLVQPNAAGRRLQNAVVRISPRSPQRGCSPCVATSVEHLDCSVNQRYWLVVPEVSAGSLRGLHHIHDWLEPFGISVTDIQAGCPREHREEISTWFAEPERAMWSISIRGGVYSTVWQFAVLSCVSDEWWASDNRLESMHLMTNIQGRPRFRKKWSEDRR